MMKILCWFGQHKFVGHELSATRTEALDRMIRGLSIWKSYRCKHCGKII